MGIISGGIVAAPAQTLWSEATFEETAGAGTYTAAITVPANSWLVEVVVQGVDVWNASGAVSMTVGDVAVANGLLTITSLKAAGDLVAGESLSLAGGAGTTGGEEGGDVTGSAWTRRFLSTERVISGVISAAGTGGSTGRTRMLVGYTSTGLVGSATKV